ncbi:autotransporter domain-containing protein [Serratia sp. UGAL515B_01]|uniref:autotransporter domain-containing protein n=1 Tax=Serratia sp. UGAL515B_01 TaxID=2986763 RepID=UPI002953D4FB|nr:autotransporter domain-containing protein [Serratia sp. UGAL515B_01]WON76448.1 autotransporter domain-containing protein [Serratia sp. UGAL515B_01]
MEITECFDQKEDIILHTPKLTPLATILLVLFSANAMANGQGGNSADFYGLNGAYSGPGGGGGANGLGGVAFTPGRAGNGSNGGATGNGGNGANGARAELTDPASTGGNGGLVGSSLTNYVGGNGGNGGDALCLSGCSSGFGSAGGGGGGAGFYGTDLSVVTDAARGGNGGNGGQTSTTGSGADGGSGGGGGAGVYLTGSGTTITNASITGGNGGNGGNGSAGSGGAGYGGGGGGGLVSTGVNVINSQVITGGNGGIGGNALTTSFNSAGGAGGAGVNGSSFSFTNTGTVQGGNGGSSTAGARARGIADLGGAGIIGSNLNVITSGVINGGLAGDTTTRANAITFDGGTNSLELRSGFSFNGTVVGTGTDTLILGGDADSSFDLTQIGTAAQYRGFTQFGKTGNSTWILNNIAAQALNWNVQAGILELALTNALNGGSVSLSGGELSFSNAGTFNGNVTLNQAAPINVNIGTVTLSGLVSGLAGLTKLGAGNLELSNAATYTGNTEVQAGTLTLGAADAIASSAAVTIDSGAQLALGANDQQINNLSGAGNVQGTATLAANNSSDSTYSGTLTSANLTKTGTGTLTMSGSGNTLSGNVLASAGVLNWENTDTVQIDGNYTTATGATTSIGSTQGRLAIGGDLIQEAGSILSVTIGASTDITARSAQLDGAIINFDGFTDPFVGNLPARASQIEGQSYTVMQTTDGITGFTPSTVQHPDYLLVDKSLANGDLDLLLGTRLAWTSGSLEESTGSFTLASGTGFNVDVVLADQTGPFIETGWDGNSLTKNGAGLLQLSAVNTYTGGTTLNDGILEISQDANLGASSGALTFNGGTLQVDQSFTTSRTLNVATNGGALDVAGESLTLAGTLEGEGNLEKTGAGTLNLQGDASNYTGDLAINQGDLNLNTSLGGSLSGANNSTLYTYGNTVAGDLTLSTGSRLVMNSASLVMSRAIQPMSLSAAAISPLNTFTVLGNASFANGGIYAPSINESGAADLLSVAGNANLTGGGLAVTALPGNYSVEPMRYLVLTANGGVTGEFWDYSISNPLLSLTPEYDANNVYLSVARNDRSISSIGVTPNQRQVGAAIDSLGGLNRLNSAIVALLDVNAINNALNQVSGEIYASLKSAMIEDTHFIRDAANDRLRSASNGVGGNSAAYNEKGQAIKPTTPDQVFWVNSWGSWGNLNGSSDTGARMTKNIAGFVMGSDVQVGEWRVGGLAGYTHTSNDVESRASSSKGNNYHVGAYAGRSLGMAQLRTGLAYSRYNNSVERSVDFPGFSDHLTSDFNANAVQGFGELALPQQWNGLHVEPYANLAYVYLKSGSFNETGAEAALSADSQSSNSTFSTLGSRFEYRLPNVDKPVVLSAQLGWQHAYGKTTPKSTQHFNSSIDFDAVGTQQMRNALVVGTGAQVNINSDMKLGLSYQGLIGDKGRENGVMGTFNWSF